LAQRAAEWLTARATAAAGRFAVALSGGSTPRRLYQLLAVAPFRDRLPWPRIHLFWGDERCVPTDDPQRNSRMADEAWLQHVAIPERQLVQRVPHPFDLLGGERGRIRPRRIAPQRQIGVPRQGEPPPSRDAAMRVAQKIIGNRHEPRWWIVRHGAAPMQLHETLLHDVLRELWVAADAVDVTEQRCGPLREESVKRVIERLMTHGQRAEDRARTALCAELAREIPPHPQRERARG